MNYASALTSLSSAALRLASVELVNSVPCCLRRGKRAHFLPIIGETHVAAMPYEIILLYKRVTMLHGRYRFALLWPGLTMKSFTKIMSSSGDAEDAMKELVK